MKRSSGFTLVEMTVVLVATSTLLGLGIDLIHQSLRCAEIARERCAVQQTAGRVSAPFRRDLGMAQQATLAAELDELQLQSAGSLRVSWRIEKNRCVRVAEQSKGIAHRDTYQLPPQYSWKLRKTADGRFALSADSAAPGDGSPRNVVDIVATIDRLGPQGLAMEETP